MLCNPFQVASKARSVSSRKLSTCAVSRSSPEAKISTLGECALIPHLYGRRWRVANMGPACCCVVVEFWNVEERGRSDPTRKVRAPPPPHNDVRVQKPGHKNKQSNPWIGLPSASNTSHAVAQLQIGIVTFVNSYVVPVRVIFHSIQAATFHIAQATRAQQRFNYPHICGQSLHLLSRMIL